jgi:pantetheine-phosphate adenylyltransferase
MNIAVFPGSFDPFTKGHESVVRKGIQLFDKVVVAIGSNSKKTSLFSMESRKTHIQSIFQNEIEVVDYQCLTVDLCHRFNAKFVIRGIRDTKDFEYENSIAHMNKVLGSIETVFFTTEAEYTFINSSIVREIYLNGGDISSFVTNSEILVK